MTINKTRNILYKIARILGDLNAINKGRIGKRLERRAAGRYAGKSLGKIFR